MSNLYRIQQLLAFLEEDPANPFNLYALALEYQNEDPEQAAFYFNKLLEGHKDYLPTYYQAAAFYAEQEELELAKEVYERGIALARKVSNLQALKELQNAYQNFLFEN